MRFDIFLKRGLCLLILINHDAELHNLYSSPNRMIKSRRMQWAGHVARMGEARNAYRILLGKPWGKRQLGRPRRRWVDNIKIYLRETGWDGMEWIDLAQDKDHCTVSKINLIVPLWLSTLYLVTFNLLPCDTLLTRFIPWKTLQTRLLLKCTL
jgi:hypothetical protein